MSETCPNCGETCNESAALSDATNGVYYCPNEKCKVRTINGESYLT